jgi:response regulator NasT
LETQVLAYLVKPIKQSDLEAAVALVMRRFQEFRTLEAQAQGASQAIEDRLLIERAKSILMRRAGLDESAAFLRLQRLAHDKQQRLVELARTIAIAEEAFAG